MHPSPLPSSHSARHRVIRAAVAAVIAVFALSIGVTPASAAKRFVVTTKAHGASATVTGTIKAGDINEYRNLVMTIRSAKGGVVKKRLSGIAADSWSIKPSVHLADVSGDGLPDAFVDIYTGGAHCCIVSTITVSSGGSWSKPFRVSWDGGYRLRDLGEPDGTYEIIAVDPRFDYLFAAHVDAALPVTISHATPAGKLDDVSAQFPARLRTDADQWIAAWKDAGPVPGESKDDADLREYLARSTLGAALADLLRLGALDEAKALCAQSVARGDFANLPVDKKDELFNTDVAHQLQDMGFLADWSVLGLPR